MFTIRIAINDMCKNVKFEGSIQKEKNTFRLVDVPVSLRGFASLISEYHQFNINLLETIEPNQFSVSDQARLERLKTSILKQTLHKNSINGKKTSQCNNMDESAFSSYVKKLNEQTVKTSTPLLSMKFPIELADAVCILTKHYPTLSAGALRGLETKVIKRPELTAIRNFCHKCIKRSKETKVSSSTTCNNTKSGKYYINRNRKAPLPVVQERNDVRCETSQAVFNSYLYKLREQQIFVNTKLINISFPNELIVSVGVLLKAYPAIIVEEIIEIRTCLIKQSELKAIKAFCRKCLKNSSLRVASEVDSNLAINKRKSKSGSIKDKISKKSNNKNVFVDGDDFAEKRIYTHPVIYYSTLFDEVLVPSELNAIKDKTELCLSLQATIGDFLAADSASFRYVSKESVNRLKLFYQSCLYKEDHENLPLSTVVKTKVSSEFADSTIDMNQCNTSIVEVNFPEYLTEVKEALVSAFPEGLTIKDCLNLNELKSRLRIKNQTFPFISLTAFASHINKRFDSNSIESTVGSGPEESLKHDVERKRENIEIMDLGEKIVHITRKGKTLRGWARFDIDKEEAFSVDKYTFYKNGGWFIREKHEDILINFLRRRQQVFTEFDIDDIAVQEKTEESASEIQTVEKLNSTQSRIGEFSGDNLPEISLE
ncbi:hypothetical protein VHA01S_016_00300 [Vibrio halioticoli NBRC 102217]|uniref:Uncharacterized protein n=1 Tax=Vibrio halioticoli NBRC 102217 TaxID=1219072 RepID=V5FCI5_9VIBR|nr:hypothetical protein [Vibrio halioticoli]GAD89173.1 hypothetical protein VHA01S_016_00300 [Vibrio halioticoli NBRC 102217]